MERKQPKDPRTWQASYQCSPLKKSYKYARVPVLGEGAHVGLFDRFKSGTTATRKASAATRVKKGTAPSPPVDGLMNEAWDLLRADQPKQAMKVYHQALEIDPSEKDMAVRRILDQAQSVSFRYKFDEAIVYVNYALKLDPKNERAYLIKQDVSRAKSLYRGR